MAKKLTQEEFVKKIEKLHPNMYDILSTYSNEKSDITIRYKKCGHIETKLAEFIVKGNGCSTCRENEKYKKFLNRFNLMDNAKEFSIIGDYKSNRTDVLIRHDVCGNEFMFIQSDKKSHCDCPYCEPNKYYRCIPYVNDLDTVRPDVSKLLFDKECGHKYKSSSKEKVYFCCPLCGENIYASIQYVCTYGLVCHKCGVSSSFSEGLMNSILNELKIDFTPQFHPSWSKKYFYDFYFELNNKKYIVEMDGSFHNKDNKMSGQTKEESQAIDREKDIMANKQGIEIIRIDCDYPNYHNRSEYVVNNIMLSKLNDFFDLSSIDMKKCITNAQKSYIFDVAELWNNGMYDCKEIGKEIGKSKTTVKTYLMISYECNLINMNKEDIETKLKTEKIKKAISVTGIKVMCNETKEVFSSFRQANEKYKCNLSAYFRFNQKTSGALSNGTKLTWTKL